MIDQVRGFVDQIPAIVPNGREGRLDRFFAQFFGACLRARGHESSGIGRLRVRAPPRRDHPIKVVKDGARLSHGSNGPFQVNEGPKP